MVVVPKSSSHSPAYGDRHVYRATAEQHQHVHLSGSVAVHAYSSEELAPCSGFLLPYTLGMRLHLLGLSRHHAEREMAGSDVTDFVQALE